MGNCCSFQDSRPADISHTLEDKEIVLSAQNAEELKKKASIKNEKYKDVYENLQKSEVPFPVLANKIKEVLSMLEPFKWDLSEDPFSESSPCYLIEKNQQKGEWKNGRPHGRGKELFVDGEKSFYYEGYFENGKKCGKGRMISDDGSYFQGQMKEGKPDGEGFFVRSDYLKIIGNFNGYGNGTGKFTKSDNTKYNGSFLDGNPHGDGTLVLPDGSVFIGSFQNGFMLKGTIEYYNKAKQVGEFQNNNQHGKGTYYYSNGQVFSGIQVNGVKNGAGIIKSPDGAEIEGNWINGQIDGKAQGKKGEELIEYEFNNGKLIHKSKSSTTKEENQKAVTVSKKPEAETIKQTTQERSQKQLQLTSISNDPSLK